MTAEIIAVGTELLLGDILNTNAQFLSQQLAQLGVTVHFQSVVGDNPAANFGSSMIAPVLRLISPLSSKSFKVSTTVFVEVLN